MSAKTKIITQQKKPAMNKPEIKVTCKHCGHDFSVPAGAAGTETPCPECAAPTPVEAQEQEPASVPGVKTATLKPPRKRLPKPAPLMKAPPVEPDAEAPAKEPEDAPPPEPPEEVAPLADEEKKPIVTKKPVEKKNALKTKAKCPECGRSMEKDAVVCLNCGFDSRGDEAPTQPTMIEAPRKTRPIAPIIVVVILAAGALYYMLFMRGDSPAPSPGSPDDASPNPTSEFPDGNLEEPPFVFPGNDTPPPDPEGTMETIPLSDPAPEIEAEGAVAEPPETVETPDDPDAPPTVRQQIEDRWDAQHPLFKAGDSVILNSREGTTYRGKIIEINDTAVRLYYRGSEGEVPIRSLTPRSRAQVDPAFREQLITSLVEKSQDGEEN